VLRGAPPFSVRAEMRSLAHRRLPRAPFVAVVLLTLVAACSGGSARPRDIAGDRGPSRDAADGGAYGMVPEAPPATIQPTVDAKKPRLVAHASTRALAVDATNLYYGDSEDDGIFALAKAGGQPVRLGRHAPVAGAIALDTDSITWIASPGDAVHRIALRGGGQPTTLRERGIFSDVAAVGGEVFIVEAVGPGGALWRVSGATSSRVAAFDGAPRAVMADATHVYVITPTRILRASHAKGELETIATGSSFGSAEMDDGFIYVVAALDKSRVVAKVAKTGGPMTSLATGVRDGPLEVYGNEVLYFDAIRPALRAVAKTGGVSRLIVEDEAFSSASAIEADGPIVYIATGAAENGAIVAVDGR
jgi:hypothetical protein